MTRAPATNTIPVTWVRSDATVDWVALVADLAQRAIRENEALRSQVVRLEADNVRLNAVIDELVGRIQATAGRD